MEHNQHPTPPPKPTVLVYRRNILQLSETFIKEQVLALQQWNGVLIGHERGPLALDGLNVQFLGRERVSFTKRLLRKLRLAPRPTGMGSALEWTSKSQFRQLRKLGASLLHAHFGPDAVVGWPLAQALGIPMLVTLHGYDVTIYRSRWEAGDFGDAMRQYPARLLALAAEPKVHFVAVSEALRARAIEFGIPEYKISVRYIGIDVRKFRPGPLPISQRERRVLFVGRLVEKKGCTYLLSAMAEVQKRIPDVQLIIVGDGPLRASLEIQAAQHGVHATFRGALDTNGVREEMDQAAVFCLPSVRAENGDAEGLPISILEAQACGVPVVTSAHGGATEGILDGKSGRAFAEGDHNSLANLLLENLDKAQLCDILSDCGAHFASRQFDIRLCTAALEHLYNNYAFDSHIS